MTTYVWVIGARGLLGGATAAAISRRPGWVLLNAEPLPWADDDALAAAAAATAARLLETAATERTNWAVLWLAGNAVTSTPPAAIDRELRQLRLVLDAVGTAAAHQGTSGAGAVFYASSAGGVYGGSAHPPFNENSAPVPISGYGRFKLDAEASLFAFSRASGVSVLAGRIANLYGPGQKLGKMQGLISHLAKAQFSPKPASIFVPLETMRDYIFVRDCAELVVDCVARLLEVTAATGRTEVIKNLASGQAVTISNLLGQIRSLAKGQPNVMLGYSAEASMQGLDLRITSTVWPDLDRRQLTSLPAGIKATMDDVLAHIQSGG
ncbi:MULTISPECIES: NAD-dependent epimerase/dehydratase family protein [unclassified Cryobacterium]|uniref:NAD-dependent epimerase/dehydratase family protein n=1 Tax=unclassified Cryobacterium TaxID=2649013 RepID=UPI00106A2836|nr:MULTISPECIES: NAD-dependent epimerase/dehydratase family protein [unclassified Cryobacterium]TFC56447.1 NAD-dependent epimerase/dehydratase family protein [Cryobacterium sp. TMB3-1-2]TFC56580.1 NAD-dependent epimerase/dehydratase family protein [Cryobacterium sp. TMB1-7]TFC67348.1 NAD-dependent epimerase/dehydratase family protein [Cryobacterium sp. TMB3-15]TFC73139.1 NAD-dependent epimerase/dehydratase family protein [Cryobacterium sp. TMB3-10]TFC85175.1 NAD-dependent epimerase/dehydratase